MLPHAKGATPTLTPKERDPQSHQSRYVSLTDAHPPCSVRLTLRQTTA